MPNIFKSATRVVLILFALATCAGFLIGRMTAEQFLGAAMIVFTAFFTLKGNAAPNEPDQLAGK